MIDRIKTRAGALAQAVRGLFAGRARQVPAGEASTAEQGEDESQAGLRAMPTLDRMRRVLGGAALIGGAAWLLAVHPPLRGVEPGQLGVRTNALTGTVTQWNQGSVLALPLLHDVQVYSLRERVYRPEPMRSAQGSAPLQSVEGLSFGIDLTVRYAPDAARLVQVARRLPADMDGQIVEPAVQGVVYRIFSRYTVREAFSTKRVEIQQQIESELAPRLAADGVLLRGVQIGKVDLPAEYRRGMESLIAEELQTQKMRYTLELKDKRVKETELEAAAEKVRREVRAEAAAREQVIAARAQEEAMKHVLPLKQRQVEQRRLEAEAEKQARIRAAEGAAEARRIEAVGEAQARQKLAEAEAWRLDRVGRANAEQMAREGVLVTRHPLLIQKALADKLSDKVQVIIAPPSAAGGFIASNLIGTARASGMQPAARDGAPAGPVAAGEEEE